MKFGAFIVAALVAGAVLGQEFELKNDRLVDGSTGAVQVGFIAHEIGAAVLNTDAAKFPLRILRVQIMWLSYSGGMTDVEAAAIHIYKGGGETPPNPILQTTLEGPIMKDGGLNEFDMTPYNIVMDKGPFTVGLEFLTSPDIFNGPSLVSDTNGCQAKKSLIYDLNDHKWHDACSYGMSGNIAIRVIAEYAGAQTTISGKVNLGGGFVGSPNGVPVTVDIKNGSTLVDTQSSTLDATGAYSVTTHNTGTYDLVLKSTHWLAEKKPGVTMSGALTADWLLQRNGDVNNTNTIDLFDVTGALIDWGATGSPADVDGSGTVNLFDLNLILLGFGEVGAS